MRFENNTLIEWCPVLISMLSSKNPTARTPQKKVTFQQSWGLIRKEKVSVFRRDEEGLTLPWGSESVRKDNYARQ
eukprot:g27696.t1